MFIQQARRRRDRNNMRQKPDGSTGTTTHRHTETDPDVLGQATSAKVRGLVARAVQEGRTKRAREFATLLDKEPGDIDLAFGIKYSRVLSDLGRWFAILGYRLQIDIEELPRPTTTDKGTKRPKASMGAGTPCQMNTKPQACRRQRHRVRPRRLPDAWTSSCAGSGSRTFDE